VNRGGERSEVGGTTIGEGLKPAASELARGIRFEDLGEDDVTSIAVPNKVLRELDPAIPCSASLTCRKKGYLCPRDTSKCKYNPNRDDAPHLKGWYWVLEDDEGRMKAILREESTTLAVKAERMMKDKDEIKRLSSLFLPESKQLDLPRTAIRSNI
jgi:hypothetical protein